MRSVPEVLEEKEKGGRRSSAMIGLEDRILFPVWKISSPVPLRLSVMC
jgi:hypothetical protein